MATSAVHEGIPVPVHGSFAGCPFQRQPSSTPSGAIPLSILLGLGMLTSQAPLERKTRRRSNAIELLKARTRPRSGSPTLLSMQRPPSSGRPLVSMYGQSRCDDGPQKHLHLAPLDLRGSTYLSTCIVEPVSELMKVHHDLRYAVITAVPPSNFSTRSFSPSGFCARLTSNYFLSSVSQSWAKLLLIRSHYSYRWSAAAATTCLRAIAVCTQVLYHIHSSRNRAAATSIKLHSLKLSLCTTLCKSTELALRLLLPYKHVCPCFRILLVEEEVCIPRLSDWTRGYPGPDEQSKLAFPNRER